MANASGGAGRARTKVPRTERQPATRKPKERAPRLVRQIKWKRPWLYKEQTEFLFNGLDSLGRLARYVIVEASTKTGKTVGCIVWLMEMAAIHGGPNKNFWWVAPTYAQADIAFRRFVQYCPADFITVNYSKLTITLINGARIWFKTAEKPDSLYGEDVYACVIDEATRCRAEAWHAIRSTLTATKGPIRIIGNVKGKKNWAYKLARRAESGTPNMFHARLTAYHAVAAGILPMEEIEDAKNMLPEDVFNELYLAIPTEDGANPFGYHNLDACAQNKLADGPVAYFGVDLGRAVDWTVITGLNKGKQVCHYERFQEPWPETLNRLVRTIGHKPCLIDSTGLGDPVTAFAQKKLTNMEGFVFSSRSKQDLMEGLAIAVQRHQVGVLDGVMMQEMRDFEFEYTRTGVRYSAPEGLHDDAVCSLALAVKCGSLPQASTVRPHAVAVFQPFSV